VPRQGSSSHLAVRLKSRRASSPV